MHGHTRRLVDHISCLHRAPQLARVSCGMAPASVPCGRIHLCKLGAAHLCVFSFISTLKSKSNGHYTSATGRGLARAARDSVVPHKIGLMQERKRVATVSCNLYSRGR